MVVRKALHMLVPRVLRFSSTRRVLSTLEAQTLRQRAVLEEVAPSPGDDIDYLVDSFGRRHTYLRISVAEKCNLRCTYCMPEEGVPLNPAQKLLSADEIVRIAGIFAANGVTKIRLTGGEPTIRKDIVEIVGRLAAIPGIKRVGMTTNGIALRRKLDALASAGLTRLNISLDTLNEAKYMVMTRRNGFKKVIKAIEAAESLFDRVKINNVVIRGINDDELVDFVALTESRDLDVRFIEYMPFGGNKFESRKMVPYKEILKIVDAEFPMIVKLKDHPNDTSKAYRVHGFRGRFGFISSMSDHFCSTCNRLRITADGNLKVCLHGNSEVSLRDVLRAGASDEHLEHVVRQALSRKKKQHAGSAPAQFSHHTPHYSSLFSVALLNGLSSANDLYTKGDSSRRFLHKACAQCSSTPPLSHVTGSGKANMVDVTDKRVTSRTAVAECIVKVTAEVMKAIVHNDGQKGDVLGVARIAGIQAAKRTSSLIPLCHNIFISSVKINFHLDQESNEVVIRSLVRTKSETGVEMEALTAVTAAALTVYDMCKALTHNMLISQVRLVAKNGGKRDFGTCEL